MNLRSRCRNRGRQAFRKFIVITRIIMAFLPFSFGNDHRSGISNRLGCRSYGNGVFVDSGRIYSPSRRLVEKGSAL